MFPSPAFSSNNCPDSSEELSENWSTFVFNTSFAMSLKAAKQAEVSLSSTSDTNGESSTDLLIRDDPLEERVIGFNGDKSNPRDEFLNFLDTTKRLCTGDAVSLLSSNSKLFGAPDKQRLLFFFCKLSLPGCL